MLLSLNGADVKLTLWKILDRDPIRTDEVLAKLSGDLQMDLIRVPMVAHWEVEGHEEVFDFAATARNNYSMKVFVSVANTDGVPTDSILGNAHHVDKFPDAWQCDGCPNAGTFNLDLDIYQSWLLNLTTMFGVDRMDYLGPFNEDAVDAFDVNMTHTAGVAMVSVEARNRPGWPPSGDPQQLIPPSLRLGCSFFLRLLMCPCFLLFQCCSAFLCFLDLLFFLSHFPFHGFHP